MAKVIYSAFTSFSGEIKVIEANKVRRLVIGGLVQSVSRNFPEVEKKIWGELLKPPFEVKRNPKVLMLGLGGGTTLHLLSESLKPVLIKVLEIDSRIIQVAEDYFDVKNIPDLQIINADASDYLGAGFSEKFDLVIVDLYCGSKFHPEALTNSFYHLLKKKLSLNGVVSVNRIYPESAQAERESFLKILNSVFDRVFEKVLEGPSHVRNYLYFCQV